MTDTTMPAKYHPLLERKRCQTAAAMGLDPRTLKPLPRAPRSTLQRATEHANAVVDDLLSERERIAYTAALAALSQAESASRSATALESIAEALTALAGTGG